MLILGVQNQVELHALVLSPRTEWQLIASLPNPEPRSEAVLNHSCAAVWAANGSAVALWYSIQNPSDARRISDNEDFFEVRSRAAIMLLLAVISTWLLEYFQQG